MSHNPYPCGVTFQQLCICFHIGDESAKRIKRHLLGEGYTERGICYGAGRAHEKLLKFVGDPRFDNIFENEVRKYALKPGDPRWETKSKKWSNANSSTPSLGTTHR